MTSVSYDAAFAITTLCVCAFYLGSVIRKTIPEYLLGADAVTAGRYVALPLILTTAVVMSLLLFTARASFNDKQDLISDMASNALQLDRALEYFGTPADKAQRDFHEYLTYMLKNPKAIYELADRTTAEKFAIGIQSLPIPKGDAGVAINTKNYMVELMGKMSRDRFHLATKAKKIIYPFSLTLLAVWLVIIFTFCGITAPVMNAPNFWFSVLASGGCGSVVFLIVEYSSSSSGFIQLDTSPFDLVLKNIAGG